MTIQNALPSYGNAPQGLRTAYATLLPPGAKVAAYVCSLGNDALDAYATNGLLVSTLQAGLARCRPGKGDIVVVLPGHAEAMTAADFFSNLVAGTQVIGMAPFRSNLMPTFTITTTTAANMLLDVPGVLLSGLKFAIGVNDVANTITVSAAGCRVDSCYFQTGTASNLASSNTIIVAAGADDFVVSNSLFSGTGTAVMNGPCVSVTGAVNGLTVMYNDMECSTVGATTGLVQFSAAATQFRVVKNNIVNRRATAAVAIRWSDTAGLAGIIAENNLAFTADITGATAALSAAGTTNHAVRAFDNLVHDENQGTAIPAVMTSAATIE